MALVPVGAPEVAAADIVLATPEVAVADMVLAVLVEMGERQRWSGYVQRRDSWVQVCRQVGQVLGL